MDKEENVEQCASCQGIHLNKYAALIATIDCSVRRMEGGGCKRYVLDIVILTHDEVNSCCIILIEHLLGVSSLERPKVVVGAIFLFLEATEIQLMSRCVSGAR